MKEENTVINVDVVKRAGSAGVSEFCLEPGQNTMIMDFITGIGSSGSKEGDEHLDKRKKQELCVCQDMIAFASRLMGMSKIIMAAVAHKISAENLWSGEYDCACDCVMKLLKVKRSTAYRYIDCGSVIQAVAKKHKIMSLPNSIDALAPFSELKDDGKILESYEAALKKSKGGAITRKVAQTVVNKITGQNTPSNAVDQAVSTVDAGKENKRTESTPPCREDELITDIANLVEELGDCDGFKHRHIIKLISMTRTLSQEYLERPLKPDTLEKLKKSAKDLLAVFKTTPPVEEQEM